MRNIEILILALGIASAPLGCSNGDNREIPEECTIRCNIPVPAYCEPLLFPDQCPTPDGGKGPIRVLTCPLTQNEDGTYISICGHVPIDYGLD